jgi:hypothetical protein
MSGSGRVPGAGPLRNGNHRGNPNSAPRCAARTRSGGPCRSPAMASGRCRMHGGASTGPRTAAGRERSRAANLVHGYRTVEAREQHRQARVPTQAVTAYVALLRGKALNPERGRPWPRLKTAPRNAPPSGARGHPPADPRSAVPASE